MLRRPALALLALAVPVALFAACGDDDDGGGSSADQELVDAWVVNLSSADEDGSLAVPEEDAECMAAALVDGLGADVFDEADVTAEDIEEGASPGELLGDGAVSEDDARSILDDWTGCTDLDRLLAETTSGGLGLDDDQVDCLAEALGEEGDIAVEALLPSFTTESGEPPQDVLSRFTILADECSGALVDSIAESLASGQDLTDEQARCLAEHVIDTIGRDRLVDQSLASGEFEDATPEFQQEMEAALLSGADACGVPVSSVSGE